MNFFKGLMTVSWIYLLFWVTYNWGFIRGYEDAKNDYSHYKFNQTRFVGEIEFPKTNYCNGSLCTGEDMQ
jgi:hypothetical protein